MPIRVTCPSCGRVGKAPDEAIGRKARCPACQTSYVLTAELVEAGPDAAPVETPARPAPARPETLGAPAPEAKPPEADDTYGLDPGAIERASRPVPSPRFVPGPAASGPPEPEGGRALPVPALVGGGIGLVLVSVLAAWGLGVFGGRAPSGEGPKGTTVAQGPPSAPAKAPSGPARVEAAGSEPAPVSVVDMLLLDEPTTASAESDRAGDSDVASKPPEGAAAPVVTAGANDAADGGKALSTADIVEESEPSVALIKGKGSSGTGFLVGPGLVATNAHVINDEFASDLEVRFVSADEAHREPIKAELLYEDPERDLAFLAVKTDLKPLRIAKTYAFRKGEDITVIGNPGMGDGQVLENAISRGVMSTKAKIDDKNFYQLNIAINPGNSGGPVFDSSGRVIGVATLKSAKQEATGFCIPIEDLQAAIARVGSQPDAEAEKYRSKHRTTVALKALGGGGAVLCLLIDLRKVDAQASNPQVKEVLARLETVADGIEKELVPSLAAEGPLLRNDQALEARVRTMINELSDNFTKIRTAASAKKGVDDRQLRNLKQAHRRLITALSSTLKIEVPKELMVAFDDHNPAQPQVVMVPPSNLGPRLSPRTPAPSSRTPGGTKRPPTARERLLQKKNGGR